MNPHPYLAPVIVGVTGHRFIQGDLAAADPSQPHPSQLSDATRVKKAIRDVLEWVLYGREAAPLRKVPIQGERRVSPVIVLSSLAPGADTWVAEEALALGMRVIAPLPFPPELYLEESSSFKKGGPLEPHWKQAFQNVLGQLAAQDVFTVETADDVHLSIEELEAKLKADATAKDGENRNRRYRAAGEFISAHCDLLLAVCDLVNAADEPCFNPSYSRKAQSGTGWIVRSHLQGAEPGILSSDPPLNWADNGPVIRIFCPNGNTSSPPAAASVGMPQAGEIALWHPSVDGPICGQDCGVEYQGFVDFLTRLEELNRVLLSRPVPRQDPAEQLLRKADEVKTETDLRRYLGSLRSLGKSILGWLRNRFQKSHPAVPPPSAPHLTHPTRQHWIAGVRRLVADENRRLEALTRRHLRALFCIGILITLILQINEVQRQKGGSILALTLLAGFFFAMGLWKHQRLKRGGHFDLQNDTRALAEGLRVQFFWDCAGIGQAAASRYLQRSHGALSWIRAVIYNVSLPQDKSRREFEKLEPAERYSRLRQVVESWVAEQAAYFVKSTRLNESRQALYGFLGNSTLTAAATIVFVNFFEQHSDQRLLDAHAFLQRAGPCCGYLLLLIPLLWFVRQLIAGLALRPATPATSWGQKWRALDRWLHQIPPVWWFLPAGILLGLALECLLHHLPEHGSGSDKVGWIDYGYGAKGMLFFIGALFHFWSSLRFTTENSRRYAAMRDLFQAAHTRLKKLLQEHEKTSDSAEKQRLLAAIQGLLLALGTEALHENTDWLEMHRDRPPEPPDQSA